MQKPKSRRPVISRFSRWIRIYTSIRHDPKILCISPELRWDYVCILTIAGETSDGILPPIEAIAIELRHPTAKAAEVIQALIERGLIDVVAYAGTLTKLRPHGWNERQFKSDHDSGERSRRSRQASKKNELQESN